MRAISKYPKRLAVCVIYMEDVVEKKKPEVVSTIVIDAAHPMAKLVDSIISKFILGYFRIIGSDISHKIVIKREICIITTLIRIKFHNQTQKVRQLTFFN